MACKPGVLPQITLEGIHIHNDKGCPGETHTYTISAPGATPPFKYEWRIDECLNGPIYGTGSIFSYTFPLNPPFNKQICSSVISKADNCTYASFVHLETMECPDLCKIECRTESVNIPEGSLLSLKDFSGHKYQILGGHFFECNKFSKASLLACEAIAYNIKAHMDCDASDLKVSVKPSFTKPECLTLTIENSPIKFKYIELGSGNYRFNTGKC